MKYTIVLILLVSFFTYGCSTSTEDSNPSMEADFDGDFDLIDDDEEELERERQQQEEEEEYQEPMEQSAVQDIVADVIGPAPLPPMQEEEVDGELLFMTRDCNVRSHPSSRSKVLNTIKDRRRLWVEIVGDTGWYKVHLRRTTGYMHGVCFAQ